MTLAMLPTGAGDLNRVGWRRNSVGEAIHEHTALSQGLLGPERAENKPGYDKKLDIDFKAITFSTYGAFGKSTHSLIKKATADAQESVFCPWVAPGPRQHAYLLFGLSLIHI